MMKKIFIFAIGLWGSLFSTTHLCAQTYDVLWKQYSTYVKQDYPQSAAKVCRSILQKAQKERNEGQRLKAQMTLYNVRCALSRDSVPTVITELNHLKQTAASPVMRAVWASLLGDVYSQDGQTEKAEQSYREAVMAPYEPLYTSALNLSPFMVKGDDSKVFQHDLLSLLVLRGHYDEQYKQQLWKQMAQTYQQKGNEEASRFFTIDATPFTDEAAFAKMTAWAPTSMWRNWVYTLWVNAMVRNKRSKAEIAQQLEDCIAHTTDAQAVEQLRQLLLTQQSFSFNFQLPSEPFIPNRTTRIPLRNVCNVKQLTLQWWKMNNATEQEKKSWNKLTSQQFRKLLSSKGTLAKQMVYTLPFQSPYVKCDTILQVDTPAPGTYGLVLECTPSVGNYTEQNKMKARVVNVSDIRLFTFVNQNDDLEVMAVHAQDGSAFPDVTVNLSSVQKKTDAEGRVVFDMSQRKSSVKGNLKTMRIFRRNDPLKLSARAGNDVFVPDDFYYYNHADEIEALRHPDTLRQTTFFTDRAIYQPGDSLHLAAVLYSVCGVQSMVRAHESATVVMEDVNGREVAHQSITSDAHGKLACSFVIPKNALNGRYNLVINNESGHTISVEAYKAPTFMVSVNPVEGAWKGGDTLSIQGNCRTYSGAPLQKGKVKYKVSTVRYFAWQNNVGAPQLQRGDATLNEEGHFKFTITVPKIDNTNYRWWGSRCQVTVDVTSEQGETRTSSVFFPLNQQKASLRWEAPAQAERQEMMAGEEAPFRLLYLDADGKSSSVEAQLWVRKVGSERNAMRTTCRTNTSLPNDWCKALASGCYEAVAVVGQDTARHSFIWFSRDDKQLACDTIDWFFSPKNSSISATQPAQWQVGSNAPNSTLYYWVMADDKCVERRVVTLRNGVMNFKFPYKKEYGNGLTVVTAMMHKGRLYRHQARFPLAIPDRKLCMKWTTFRNRVAPGNQEAWELQVTTSDGKAAKAQVTATMYDYALDEYAKHQWRFYLNRTRRMVNYSCNMLSQWYANTFFTNTQPANKWKEPSYRFDAFSLCDWQGMSMIDEPYRLNEAYNTGIFYTFDTRSGTTLQKNSMRLMGSISGLNMVTAAAPPRVADMMETKEESSALAAEEATVDEAKDLRAPSAGTAFFFPALQTDKNGKVTLRFKVPGQLTTWRFIAFAHTDSLNHVLMADTILSQRPLSIQPNYPRFVRMGDDCNLRATVRNQTEKAEQVTVTAQVFDALTQRLLLRKEQELTLKAGTEQTVAVPWTVGDESTQVVCRWTVDGKTANDGEQQQFDVLPQQTVVTDGVALALNHPDTLRLQLDSLFRVACHDGRQREWRLDWTSHPVWYAVEALPGLLHPCRYDALSLASACYSARLSKHLMQQRKGVKAAVAVVAYGTDSTSYNALEDATLKTISPEATPWLGVANRERWRKMQLRQLLNNALLDSCLTAHEDQLSQLQTKDGSFSWWPGMDGSFYITQQVALQLTRLQQMCGLSATTQQLLDKAVHFLDSKMDASIKERTKLKKKLTLNGTDLDYLYLTSYRKERSAQANVNMQRLLALLPTAVPQFNIRQKAMAAEVLARMGKNKEADIYLNSILEYSVYDAQKGRRFDPSGWGYYWQEQGVPTQVAVIMALHRLHPENKALIQQFCQWLILRQQQTVRASAVNAVATLYTLCEADANDFADKSNDRIGMEDATGAICFAQTDDAVKVAPVQMTWTEQPDGRSIISTLGAFGEPVETSTEQQNDDLRDGMKMQGAPVAVEVQKQSDGPSYGSVAVRYTLPLSKVLAQGQGLTITKRLGTVDKNGKFVELRKGETLTVGSKVTVRLQFDADRDYDFVQISDERPACFEPGVRLSGYRFGNRVGYYEAVGNHTTDYFMNHLSKGHYTIDTTYDVDRNGTYQAGVATIQCAYAPAFCGHTDACTLTIDLEK